MLEFYNVSKSFWTGTQRKVILDRASFRVELGRSLGILAPKKPDEGEVRKMCRVSFPLGFMGGVSGSLSAMENSRYIARLYALDPDYIEAYCRYVCNLAEYFDQPVGTYSAGMKARFTFALLLALDFDIYLVDEGMPTYMDVEFNKKAGDILKEKLLTTTVVIVSHDPQVLAQYAVEAGVLINGQLQMFDTLEEAKHQPLRRLRRHSRNRNRRLLWGDKWIRQHR